MIFTGEILDRLRSERVLLIESCEDDSGSVMVNEACDEYFFCTLNKEEMYLFAEEIRAIADKLV